MTSATAPATNTPPLRTWQRRALTQYLARRPVDYLAVATPGAGKTAFALRVASELLADHTIQAITVVTPTEHLKTQWAGAAARVGIALDPQFRNAAGGSARDFHGVAVTYAQVAAHPMLHRARTDTRRTLVILDEVHHAGDALSWGDAVREAFQPAVRRLALTGTPFRSDDNPIPFVGYERGPDGLLRSRSDYSYGYGEALRDGVVRPVIFLAYSGETRWRTRAGEEHAVRLGEPLPKEYTARAWRTALDPSGEWIPQVLAAADTRLSQVRASMPDAGGLVIASDHVSARAYAGHLARITGQSPVVVLSDDPKASGRIAEFATSQERWMVAVRMVSEGVDVPRLAVGVYATSVNTALFFAQAVGRFVRARRSGETASVFLPSVPSLLELAGEMESERDHVLGDPAAAEEGGWDDDLLERAQRREDEAGEDDRGYETLEARAELDQVIFDGASFGLAATPGTPEEEDYLGLPGLLEPDQVATLLREHQAKQLAKQKRRTEGPPAPGSVPMHEVRANLRRELNGLVAAYHHRTNRPHGSIHAQLRAQCGGPPVALASTEDLQRRIEEIRRW